jgi:hypothetical protein
MSNHNISYKCYYININIEKNNFILFNLNTVNIYTNILQFFGDKSFRYDAIKYFKNYIINKVDNECVNDVLDKFNFYIRDRENNCCLFN